MSTLLELLALVTPDFPNALCKSVNPELMTPDTRVEMNFGKSVCCKCDHKKECLDVALKNREVGIWGGTDDDEREEMRRAQKRLGIDLPKRKRATKLVGTRIRIRKVSA